MYTSRGATKNPGGSAAPFSRPHSCDTPHTIAIHEASGNSCGSSSPSSASSTIVMGCAEADALGGGAGGVSRCAMVCAEAGAEMGDGHLRGQLVGDEAVGFDSY